MISLSPEQTQALLSLLSSAKSFLSTVETEKNYIGAQRDSLIDDCEQWRGVILRKLDSPAVQPGEAP